MSKDKDSLTFISNLNSKDISDEIAIQTIKDYFSSFSLELDVTKKSFEEIKILLNTKPQIFAALLNECCKSIENELIKIKEDIKEIKLLNLCKLLIAIFHSEFQSNKNTFLIEEDISMGSRVLDILIQLLFLPNFTVLNNKTNLELAWFVGKDPEDKLITTRMQIILTLMSFFSQKLYTIENEFLDPFLILFLSNKDENNALSTSFLNSIMYLKKANLKGNRLKESLELSSSACNLCSLLLITKDNSKDFSEKIPKWAEKIVIKSGQNEKDMGLKKNFQLRNFFKEYICGLNDFKYLNDIIQGMIYNINESVKHFGFSNILKSHLIFLLSLLNETQIINILGRNDINLMEIWISISTIFKKSLEETSTSNEDLPLLISMIFESLCQNKNFSVHLNGQNKIKVNLNNNKSSYADMFYTFLFEVIDSLKINQEKIKLSLMTSLGNTSYFTFTLNKTTSNVIADYFTKELKDKETNENVRKKYLYQLARIYYGLLKFHYFGNLEVACSLFPLIELLENVFPNNEDFYKSNPYFKIIFSYLDYYYKGFGLFPPVEYLEQTAFQGIIPEDCIEMEILKENDDMSITNITEIVYWNNLILEGPIDIFDLSLTKRIPIKMK